MNAVENEIDEEFIEQIRQETKEKLVRQFDEMYKEMEQTNRNRINQIEADYEKRISQLKQTVAQLRTSSTTMKDPLALVSLQNRVEELQLQLKNRDATIEGLGEQIFLKETEVKNLASELKV